MNYKIKVKDIKAAQWNPYQIKESMTKIINLISEVGYWNYYINNENKLIIYDSEIEEPEKSKETFILKPTDFLILVNNSIQIVPKSIFTLFFEPNIELKECPFCGQKETLECLSYNEIHASEEKEEEDDNYTVCCNHRKGGCGAIGGYRRTKEEAIKVWNKRKE